VAADAKAPDTFNALSLIHENLGFESPQPCKMCRRCSDKTKRFCEQLKDFLSCHPDTPKRIIPKVWTTEKEKKKKGKKETDFLNFIFFTILSSQKHTTNNLKIKSQDIINIMKSERDSLDGVGLLKLEHKHNSAIEQVNGSTPGSLWAAFRGVAPVLTQTFEIFSKGFCLSLLHLHPTSHQKKK